MRRWSATLLLGACSAWAGAPAGAPDAGAATASWQACTNLTGERDARLACFDRWAAEQGAAGAIAVSPPGPAPLAATPPVTINITTPAEHDCRSPQYSELSRFWELEAGTDCGTFGIRGYRPISLSVIDANRINTQPSSPTPGHTAAASLDYRPLETRIQLSIRTKIAQGLLTRDDSLRRDSLWFGYTQQSYWQLFNSGLSRPFRNTDHEPEFTYIYPFDAALAGGWRLRYAGLSAVHQSNGQSLPLSRSWNRTVLMAGLENGDRLRLQGRIWKRLNENPADDDNPDISNLVGRAELAAFWNLNPRHTLGATLRHSLRAQANGSLRLEWLSKLGDGDIPGISGGLRLHTQLFSGYGDSLIDYNRRRTVLSIGLSLVDW